METKRGFPLKECFLLFPPSQLCSFRLLQWRTGLDNLEWVWNGQNINRESCLSNRVDTLKCSREHAQKRSQLTESMFLIHNIYAKSKHIKYENDLWKIDSAFLPTPVWRAWLERSMAREMTNGDHAWGPQAANIWKILLRFVRIMMVFTIDFVHKFFSSNNFEYV